MIRGENFSPEKFAIVGETFQYFNFTLQTGEDLI